MAEQSSETLEVLVGRIGRAHGIRGDVFIDVRTDEPERRFAADTVFDTDRGPLTVTTPRWHGRHLLVTFAEIGDRSAAEAMRGVELRIEVSADERPADPEEFYDHQLIGLRAETEAGEPIGEVAEVLHLPAQDVLLLRHQDRDILVPFVADLVPVVDTVARRMVVADRPGLLDPDGSSAALPDRRDDTGDDSRGGD
jgi:16S rRNA processing protein RimM